MAKSKKIAVRPVGQGSILDKKFKKVIETEKRVRIRAAHPLFVLSDLKKGSLKSLARHMRETGGIADSGITLELLKLIDGSVHDTPFRILVVDHPDKPSDQGGRPTSKSAALTQKEEVLLARFDAALVTENKHDLALDAASKDAGVSASTISRAIRKRKRLIEAAAERAATNARLEALNAVRKAALDRLRKKSDG